MTDALTLNYLDRLNQQIDAFVADPILAAEREMRRRAEASVEHLVASHARILIEEPWRVARIVHDADSLDFGDLCTAIARRFDHAPPKLFDEMLALKSLNRAIQDEQFVDVWEAHRARYEKMEIGR